MILENRREELLKLLGKTFKGTLILDEILDPYFIIRYAEGGFGVFQTRLDSKENLKYKTVGYPSTFTGCLDLIAKEQQHKEGQIYESIQEYISNWKEICTRILKAYKEWNVNRI